MLIDRVRAGLQRLVRVAHVARVLDQAGEQTQRRLQQVHVLLVLHALHQRPGHLQRHLVNSLRIEGHQRVQHLAESDHQLPLAQVRLQRHHHRRDALRVDKRLANALLGHQVVQIGSCVQLHMRILDVLAQQPDHRLQPRLLRKVLRQLRRRRHLHHHAQHPTRQEQVLLVLLQHAHQTSARMQLVKNRLHVRRLHQLRQHGQQVVHHALVGRLQSIEERTDHAAHAHEAAALLRTLADAREHVAGVLQQVALPIEVLHRARKDVHRLHRGQLLQHRLSLALHLLLRRLTTLLPGATLLLQSLQLASSSLLSGHVVVVQLVLRVLVLLRRGHVANHPRDDRVARHLHLRVLRVVPHNRQQRVQNVHHVQLL